MRSPLKRGELGARRSCRLLWELLNLLSLLCLQNWAG